MLMAASLNFSSSSSAAARVLLYRESNRSSNSYTCEASAVLSAVAHSYLPHDYSVHVITAFTRTH